MTNDLRLPITRLDQRLRRRTCLLSGRRQELPRKYLPSPPASRRNEALRAAASHLARAHCEILNTNAADRKAAQEAGRPKSFIDRLTLTEARIEAMARGLDEIAALPDPVGEVIAAWGRPNGLKISRVRVPLGVIGIIYESRPNVTADAGGLCLKSGNAVVLRGGSECFESNRAIHACLVEGLKARGCPKQPSNSSATTDRDAVGISLRGLAEPSTSSSLVAAKASSNACRRRRASPCSLIWKASAMSMRTRRRTLRRRAPSCSTPSCGAPGFAARPKPSLSTRLARIAFAAARQRPCSMPVARFEAMTQLAPPILALFMPRKRIGHRVSRCHHLRESRAGRYAEQLSTSRNTVRSTRIPSSPRTPPRPRPFCAKSIAPSSCTTRPRNLPMAANSAWARKSASPRAASMRAGRLAWSSSPPLNMSCVAMDRRGLYDIERGLAEADLRPPRGRRGCGSGFLAARSIPRIAHTGSSA